MARQTKIGVNLDGLKKIVGDLQDYRAHVGVLGSSGKNGRADEDSESAGLTNAEIGAIHEFGTESIPPRSFLRMPIEEKKGTIVKKLSNSQTFKTHIEAGDIGKAVETVGVLGEEVIQQAFETKGFGQWPEKAPATKAHSKNPEQPLIESTQLRKSITSEAKRKQGSEHA